MPKVSPKLIYDKISHRDVPIWEVTLQNNTKIYYERKHYKGYVPIGIINSTMIGDTRYNVFDLVKLNKGDTINIIKETSENPIPMSWYGTDIKKCINKIPKQRRFQKSNQIKENIVIS